MENKNFYNNPLKIIWKSKNALMPKYLIFIWIILLATSLIGSFWLDFMNFSPLQAKEYFMLSSTGLTLTLALFVAGKNAFSNEDLKKLATSKGTNNDQEEGFALLNFLAPYVFTSLLFLITGLIALFCPFVEISLNTQLNHLLKIIYINTLSLGLLNLFNLVNSMLNDVLYSAFRK